MDASPPPWYQLPDAPELTKTNIGCADIGSADIGSESNPFVIVGAGLAGCNLAFELAQRDQHVLLIDEASTVADGASGNSAGIVKPFVTREPSSAAKFYTAAFEYFLHRMQDQGFAHASDFTQCGVLQLVQKNYPPSSEYRCTTSVENSALTGVRINSHGIFFERAGWVNPAAFCSALVAHKKIKTRLNCRVDAIAQDNDDWHLRCTELTGGTQSLSIKTNQLILSNGASLHAFNQTNTIPITAARGQLSIFKPTESLALKTVISAKHYLIPANNTLHVGASFTRNSMHKEICASDHQQNLDGLNALNTNIVVDANPSGGFVGIRATTPDRLPVAGPVPDAQAYLHSYELVKNGLPEKRFKAASYHNGLSVLGGLGSRGIVSSPYCARLLSDWLCSTLPTDENRTDLQANSELLHPARFIIRQLRRA